MDNFDGDVPRILPPVDDAVFKTLLTHPDAAAALKDIVISFTGLYVQSVKVSNVELPVSDIFEKQERFDVSCVTDSGEQVDVEMQAAVMSGDSGGHRNLKSRCIYYVCDLHSSQKGFGVRYSELVRTYQLTFCGFTVFEDRESPFTWFRFRNEAGGELLDNVNIGFIELTKLGGILKKPLDEMTGADMWSVYLGCVSNSKFEPLVNKIIESRREIKMANDVLTNISQDADERAKFRARKKFQMDMEHNRLVAIDEGRAEGRAEGRVEGRAEGRADVAKRMLVDGISFESIAKYTGLSLEEIKGLQG
jgi:predicted transposase/invertase (TIGR01784 family)